MLCWMSVCFILDVCVCYVGCLCVLCWMNVCVMLDVCVFYVESYTNILVVPDWLY